jgi:hypothetical protein
MNSATQKPTLVRMWAVFCFMLALMLLVAASWLLAEGQLPSLSLGDGAYLVFGGVSINGFAVPDWAFYFLPGGLYLLAVALLFVGWRLVKPNHD